MVIPAGVKVSPVLLDDVLRQYSITSHVSHSLGVLLASTTRSWDTQLRSMNELSIGCTVSNPPSAV
jgi:hypothetical protein